MKHSAVNAAADVQSRATREPVWRKQKPVGKRCFTCKYRFSYVTASTAAARLRDTNTCRDSQSCPTQRVCKQCEISSVARCMNDAQAELILADRR